MKNIKIILLAMSVSVFGVKKETLHREENKTKKKEVTPEKKKMFEKIEKFKKLNDWKLYENNIIYTDKFMKENPEYEKHRKIIYQNLNIKRRYETIKKNMKSVSDEEKNEINMCMNDWVKKKYIKWKKSEDNETYLDEFKKNYLIPLNKKYQDEKYNIYIIRMIIIRKGEYKKHGSNKEMKKYKIKKLKNISPEEPDDNLTEEKKISKQIKEFMKNFDYKEYKDIKTYVNEFIKKYPENKKNRNIIYIRLHSKIEYIKIQTDIESVSDEEKNGIYRSMNNWIKEKDIKWESKDNQAYLNEFKKYYLIPSNPKYQDEKYNAYIIQKIGKEKKFYKENGYNRNIDFTNPDQIKKIFYKYIESNKKDIWPLYKEEIKKNKKNFLASIVKEFFNKNKIFEDPYSFLEKHYQNIVQQLYRANNSSSKEINEIKSDKDIEKIDINNNNNESKLDSSIEEEIYSNIEIKSDSSIKEEIDNNNESKLNSINESYSSHFIGEDIYSSSEYSNNSKE